MSPDRSLGRMLTTQVKNAPESPAAGFIGFSVDSMRRGIVKSWSGGSRGLSTIHPCTHRWCRVRCRAGI
jgi:hypothetical protein